MFHDYQSAASCKGKAQAGTKNLLTAANDLYDKSFSFGIYNCRPVSGGTILSLHAEGRAADIGFPVVGGVAHPQGTALALILRANAWQLGVQALIWNRKWYSKTHPLGRPYTGPNPHIDHIHVEQAWNGATSLTLANAYTYLGGDVMAFTPEEEKTLKEVVAALKAEGSNGSALSPLVKLARLMRQIDDIFDAQEF